MTNQVPHVLREESDWFVLDKPRGWHSVRGKTGADAAGAGVVESWLTEARPAQRAVPESGLVHRLDRDTSGCLVVATSPDAHATLRRRFSEGIDVRKSYLALTQRGLDAEGRTTQYFSSRHKGSAKVTVRDAGEAREAGRLRWRVLEARGDNDLVEVELIGAGRRHQIRAGLAKLGAPLVGDALYGGGLASDDDFAHLHAWRVELDDVRVEAPKPSWAGGG